MLPRNQRQEALSRAYVHAIAAQSGVVSSKPEPDFGIDLSLRFVAEVQNRHRDAGTQLDLQLKSTTRASVTDVAVKYDLEVDTYNDLRNDTCPIPRLLVVLVLPEDEAEWLTQSAEALTLRHCAYWMSLRGYPPTTATSTIRVTIPLANRFSVEAVQRLMQRVAERRDL